MDPKTPEALILPFRALRYAEAGDCSPRIAPPYDVIDADRRDALAAGDARNIVHITCPGTSLEDYVRAARSLEAWRQDGTLSEDADPTFTVMRQQYTLPGGETTTRSGLFASVAAETYGSGRVRPHEHTHAGPKRDRLALMTATGTVTEPIFLLHPDPGSVLTRLLSEVTARPAEGRGTLEGVTIETWTVAETDALREALAEGPLYIADGHHRYETAAAWGQEAGRAARTLAFIVPVTDPGLRVLATHRLIVGDGLDPETVLRDLAEVTQLAAADDADFTLVWPGGGMAPLSFYAEEVPELAASEPPPADRLLIALVEKYVTARLIARAGDAARLLYTPDPAEARLRVASGEAAVALLVRPTPVLEVLAVADSGGFMPPKSTYFYPKVPSGLVMLPLP